MAAGQKEAASEALSRWLESLSGRPDAALDLGRGGAMPALATEAALQVHRPCTGCSLRQDCTEKEQMVSLGAWAAKAYSSALRVYVAAPKQLLLCSCCMLAHAEY